jgi:DNA-binding transcriptional regulator YhcF (GntR family)
MTEHSYTEDERRQFYRCMTRIFQMERELGGSMIDAIILRAAAIGRLEDRPMSVSSLAAYVSLPRQTVSRRVQRLVRAGTLATRRDGNRTIIDTTEKSRRRNAKFVNDAIAETIEFVRTLEN